MGATIRAGVESRGKAVRQQSYPRPEPKPPSVSNESVPDLGDENHLWRSHGVIKMRVGRFLADVKLPTDGDAERLARRLADMLRRGESTHPRIMEVGEVAGPYTTLRGRGGKQGFIFG